jgi:hypothetical protein
MMSGHKAGVVLSPNGELPVRVVVAGMSCGMVQPSSWTLHRGDHCDRRR